MPRRLTVVTTAVALLGAAAAATSLPPASSASAGEAVVPTGPPVAIVDPAPSVDPSPALLPAAIEPLANTFLLHSNPGADRVILLDFDGATVSGTAWNSSGLANGSHPAWDPGSNGAAFTDAELAMVQDVWQRVAEDFAPFDVDVTTQDPGDAALVRSSPSDQQYGVRALITPSDAYDPLCPEPVPDPSPDPQPCGGLAYIDIFDWIPAPTYQPAWIFPQWLGDSSARIAEATSHEVGHTLGLVHDGTQSAEYYQGSSLWSPIMGVGYYSALTQWSNGGYAQTARNYSIDNQGNVVEIVPMQDDVAIIGGTTGLRADESGATIASAVPFANGRIAGREDVDTYAVGECTGDLVVQASPAPSGPNLDIYLELLDAVGTVLDTDDPVASADPVQPPSPRTASGLNASVGATVTAGRYFVRVDGVGTAATYGDYGSLGAYGLSVVGDCTAPSTLAPTAPRDLAATASTTSAEIELTWSPPQDKGASSVTGYVVSRVGADPVALPAGQTSYTATGLASDTVYEFAVAAVNAVATGSTATASARTADVDFTAPTPVRSLSATWAGTSTRNVSLRWTAPADDGGSAVTGYVVRMDGVALDPTTSTAATVRHVPPGAHTFTVRAINGVGVSAPASTSFTAPRYGSRTTLSVPTTARKGSRPTIRVAVTALGTTTAARGKVRILVNGRLVTTLTVRGTAVSYRLPRLPRTQRAVVVASYLGTSVVAPSRTSRTIRLTP